MPRFFTTLTADMGAADLIISVADNTGAPTTYPARFFIEEECVTVVGGVAEGLDWDIRRGAEGTDPVGHGSGAGVGFAPPGDGTHIIYDWGAFTAASVVVTGDGEVTAQANDGAGVMGAKLFLDGAGPVTLEGGAGAGSLAITAVGAISFSGLNVSIHDGISFGSEGEFLAAQAADTTALWQPLVTIQTGAPGGTYITLFVFDDTATTGGLYAWNGFAYTLVGLATT